MKTIIDKQQYKSYINTREEIPIFNKSFWLDAVCGEGNWDAVLVVEEGNIIAGMPFYTKTKYKVEIITIPTHTQRFSPCINYPEKIKTYSHKIDFENKVMMALLKAFPSKVYFQSSLHFDYKNVLPCLWSGYRVNYRHTYVIDKISSLENVFKGFSNNRKRGVKKALKSLITQENLAAEDFYRFHSQSLIKKGDKISYSKEHFNRLYNACKRNNSGMILHATDKENNIHAALFVVWDSKAAYHLIPVVNPDYYKSQAISLLVYRAIEVLKNKTESYDFEGSMMMNTEKAYREYGALPKPYFNISKSNSRLIERILCLR